MTPRFELLEERLAPATLVNPMMVRFTDVDGDRAIVAVSGGMLTLDNFTFVAAGKGEQLQTIRLADEIEEGLQSAGADFNGKYLLVGVTHRARGGDGLVNVGFIDALGIDLGRVRVAGDLGRIVVGDFNGSTPALEQLDVNSLGRFGLSTQDAEGSLWSEIGGTVGLLRVRGDIHGATVFVSAPPPSADAPIAEADTALPRGSIGRLVIGGSVRGAAELNSGAIDAAGEIAEAHIGGSLLGGSGEASGRISAGQAIHELHIAGSIRGSEGFQSGVVTTTTLGRLVVKKDIVSGSGDGAGGVTADHIGHVLVHGSLKGNVDSPVHILARGLIGLTVETEYIVVEEVVLREVVQPDGTIIIVEEVVRRLVPITVEMFVDRPARIDSVTVLGGVHYANIIADLEGSIGSVVVAGAWRASNLSAGVQAGGDGLFGTDDDELSLAPRSPSSQVGRVGLVAVFGPIRGTAESGDHFGFVARRIDRFFTLLGGGLLNLKGGPGNDDIPLGLTGDERLREISELPPGFP
jgi:hypothetical protein